MKIGKYLKQYHFRFLSNKKKSHCEMEQQNEKLLLLKIMSFFFNLEQKEEEETF